MKTKIVRLTNTRNTITLIGACHIGRKSYFDKIERIAEKSDLVLCEGVESKDAKNEILVAYYDLIARKTKLCVQPTIKKAKWINCDITIEDLGDFASSLNTAIKNEIDRAKKLSKFMLLLYMNLSAFIDPEYIENYIIGAKRNELVSKNAMAYVDTGKTVAIVYGNGHVNGIVDILVSNGYTVLSTRKIKAF